jgi:hypothetical protein
MRNKRIYGSWGSLGSATEEFKLAMSSLVERALRLRSRASNVGKSIICGGGPLRAET